MECLLYCTIALPWLYQGADGKWYVTKSKCAQVGCKPARNGFVCFECDCNESWLLRRHSGFGDNYFSNCSCENIRLQERSCLTDKQFCSYLGTYGYAYHFENVKPIYPMPITCLYKDKSCTQPLTKAPQSWCYAYQLVKGACFTQIRKILILSIRPEWLCKIANGEKDLEVRKTCPKEISRPSECSK